ncbi:MAG: hypothetical protein QW590_03005 [Candidatus Bilamarchaeaceae archaeon]
MELLAAQGVIGDMKLNIGEEKRITFLTCVLRYRWGASHYWGCDDAAYINENLHLYAVFDGISITDEGYGGGGRDAAAVAERMPELVDLLKIRDFKPAVLTWAEEIGEMQTTAIILRKKKGLIEIASAGDSFAEVDGRVVNTQYCIGNALTRWFGSDDEALGFEFIRKEGRRFRIYTDGAFEAGDDLAMISSKRS